MNVADTEVGMAMGEPLLRTLAPSLRRLDQRLRVWMDLPKRRSLSTLTQGTIDGISNDLQRQAAALDVERPLLVIILMGGTGVGKSSLLNALAHGPIAQASFARPTTRDPVVYYHESVRPERLDRAFHQCRLVSHDRPGLEQKILVDTPDLDSNDLINREKLKQMLPVADVVLYVGSQEKYHDKLGWDLFLDQRKRKAFAFILNKWDRCLHGVAPSGLRPDADLLKDLVEEGFEQPLLFRTCAQAWVESNGQPPALPEGEQFRELEHWLEAGLSRMEIEAIKARGVSQLLRHMETALEAARPPQLAEVAERTRKAWVDALETEAATTADVLLATIDPYQREIEQHFAMEGHRRFHGMMSGFLKFITRLRYFGSTMRKSLPRPLRVDLSDAATATAWDLTAFSRACSGLASDRHLDARGRALPNHLLVQADQQGFPVSLLSDPTEAVAKADWRQRYASVLIEVLHQVETDWTEPKGPRKVVQKTLVVLGDVLPLLALFISCGFLIYQYWWEGTREFHVWDLFLPLGAAILVMLMLYVVIALLLPIRWKSIRGTFHRTLSARLSEELIAAYASVPGEIAEALAAERRQMDQLLDEVREVAAWLKEREKAATIAALYGK